MMYPINLVCLLVCVRPLFDIHHSADARYRIFCLALHRPIGSSDRKMYFEFGGGHLIRYWFDFYATTNADANVIALPAVDAEQMRRTDFFTLSLSRHRAQNIHSWFVKAVLCSIYVSNAP